MIAQPVRAGALSSLALCVLLSSLGTSIATVALPTLTRAFSASFSEVQWVVLAYLLAITSLIVSVGRLGDLVGRRRLLLVGILLFTGASALGAGAPTLRLLVAARALQGLGAAMMMALALTFVGETGAAMGLLGTMSAVGTALGPSLGGLLLSAWGWPAIFLVNLPLGGLAFLLGRRHLPVDGRVPAGFDFLGTLSLSLTLTAYALAVTLGSGGLLVAAVVGLGLFLVVESKVGSPLVRLSLLRDPGLSRGLMMSALVSTVMMATLVVGPFYLARGLGLGAAAVGLVLSLGPVVAALTGVPAGRTVDRVGTERATLWGLLGMLLGSSLLSLLPLGLGAVGYVLAVIALTAGYGLFQASNNTAVMRGGGPEQRGVFSGLLNLSRNLGLISGASVMGAVFALAAGDVTTASPQAVATGVHATFAVAVVLVLVACGGSRWGGLGGASPRVWGKV